MDIEKKALQFATIAHDGQFRKADLETPYILHPIYVGYLLKKYGFDSNLVSSGFLHDVVEDTQYEQQDIFKHFGKDISSLVEKATHPDKKFSWEVRKNYAIGAIKYQDLRHKALVGADKISNLEDLRILFGKCHAYDFSAFRRGFKQQKWYYEAMYESLISGGYENQAIFLYLKELIDDIFHSHRILSSSPHFYKKQELAKLKEILLFLKNEYFLSSSSIIYPCSADKKKTLVIGRIQKQLERVQKEM